MTADNPWVVAVGVLVGLLTIDSLIGTRLIARGVMWVWNTNVADPISRLTTRRSQIQREQIRAEVLTDLRAHVAEAIRETLQRGNGGEENATTIPDLGQALKDIKTQLTGQLDAQDQKLAKLYEYAHDNNHDLRNLVTPLIGRVGLMWGDYAAAHHLDETEDEPE